MHNSTLRTVTLLAWYAILSTTFRWDDVQMDPIQWSQLSSSHIPSFIPSHQPQNNQQARTVQPPSFFLHPPSEDLDPSKDPLLKGSQPPARPDPHPLFQILIEVPSSPVITPGGVRCAVSQSQKSSRGRPSNSALRHLRSAPCQSGRKKGNWGPTRRNACCLCTTPQRLIPTNERSLYRAVLPKINTNILIFSK
jgi:hypothetical protein